MTGKKTFNDIIYFDEYGNEYWKARELMEIFDYSDWNCFKKKIDKAKKEIKNINSFGDIIKPINNIDKFKMEIKSENHFIDISDKQEDYMLSTYSCYLILKHVDYRKKGINEAVMALSLLLFLKNIKD